MKLKNKLTVTRGKVEGDIGGKGGRVVKEHVRRTQGQSQRGIGVRVGGEDGWGAGELWRENGDSCTWTTIKTKMKWKKSRPSAGWSLSLWTCWNRDEHAYFWRALVLPQDLRRPHPSSALRSTCLQVTTFVIIVSWLASFSTHINFDYESTKPYNNFEQGIMNFEDQWSYSKLLRQCHTLRHTFKLRIEWMKCFLSHMYWNMVTWFLYLIINP